MTELIRKAETSDLSDVTVLLDMASHGLLNTLWRQQAGEEESPVVLGRERIRTRTDLPSYIENWQVMVSGADIAGGCAGYKVPEPYKPGDAAELPQFYEPLLALEAHAAGTFHMIALAVFPAYRNQGIATKLLLDMERIASLSNCNIMSIIAKDSNRLACSLYEKHGYIIAANRQTVPTTGFSKTGKWLLYQRSLMTS